MEIRFFSKYLLLSTLIIGSHGTNVCSISDGHECTYTVTCVGVPGSASTVSCHGTPNVTFMITGSTVNGVTTGYFGSTNFDSRVRSIIAWDNYWPTIEGYAFRYYAKSTYADFSRNGIKTVKPEAFKNLLVLEYLDLSNNTIESVEGMTFHISDSGASALTTLKLSSNLLRTIKGETFSYTPNLKELFLDRNQISTIDEDAFNLKNVSKLFLQHNCLNTLNFTLIKIKSLIELDLSHNQLTAIHAYEVNRLVNLETVNISYNAIETVDTDSFNNAINLQVIDLRFNRIKTIIKNVMFLTNIKLRYLNLYSNNIYSIQDNAFQHNTLSFFDIGRNNLTGNLTENTFVGFNHITWLDLSNQSISLVKNYAFSNTNLSRLNMSGNTIKIIEPNSFSNLTSLTVLDLSHNKISSLDFFNNSLTNLTHLYLNDNEITVISEGVFKNQSLLITLDLSNNKIKNVQSYSLPLQYLQYFNISQNPLEGPLKSVVFSPAKFLRNLELTYFNLSQIGQNAFINMPVLAKMNLSHSEIEYIDPENFKGMGNMFSLDISYNKLTYFHLNSTDMSNLKALFLNNNRISNISKTLTNMSQLHYIDLSNNFILEVDNVDLSHLQHLSVLFLANNKLKTFNNPQINTLVNLTSLNLSTNELTEIDLSYFKELVVIDLSNNNLRNINKTFFKNLWNLQAMDLSNNNINELSPGTFMNVNVLKIINLSRNHLSNLRFGIFKGLHLTEVIDLSYNSLKTIDVDVFHECTELKRLILDYNQMTSLDVERLIATANRLITISLGGNSISCREIVRNMKTVNRNLFRFIEVTSIDKIYHEDNVHGIKCGNSTKAETDDKPEKGSTSLIVTLVLLFLAIVVGCIVFLLYKRKYRSLRSSIILNGTELSTDLSD